MLEKWDPPKYVGKHVVLKIYSQKVLIKAQVLGQKCKKKGIPFIPSYPLYLSPPFVTLSPLPPWSSLLPLFLSSPSSSLFPHSFVPSSTLSPSFPCKYLWSCKYLQRRNYLRPCKYLRSCKYLQHCKYLFCCKYLQHHYLLLTSTTTTTPPRIGIMYWVRFVQDCLTSQAPLPPPHLVLELCIGLGLLKIVWPVKHHYHHPTSYWN